VRKTFKLKSCNDSPRIGILELDNDKNQLRCSIYDNFRQHSRGFGRYVLDKIIHTLYVYTV